MVTTWLNGTLRVLRRKIHYLAFSDRTGIVRTKKLEKHDAELVLDGESRLLKE